MVPSVSDDNDVLITTNIDVYGAVGKLIHIEQNNAGEVISVWKFYFEEVFKS